ncbi:MAG: M14 family zinc carboxypeptidase [Fidelibacterota bacterium]
MSKHKPLISMSRSFSRYLCIIVIPVLVTAQSPLSERYHTYEEIAAQLALWNEEFGSNADPSNLYPGSGIIYHLEEIGQSTQEGLPFWAVRLSYNADTREDEPRVLFLGQCHAEEIYGVEITLELIEMFLYPDEHQPYLQNMQAILASSEVWIVPTYNPEGLTVVHGYTAGEEWLQDVTYRKNKRDTNLNGTFDFLVGVGNDSDGVDLNRNYDFNWIFGDSLWEEDPGGGTYQAHYDYYRGAAPFSELETEAIRDLAFNEQFLLSIAYHSSRSGNVSERVIYPWRWASDKFSPDGPIISSIGEALAALLPNEAGDGYYLPVWSSSRQGNAHDWFYTATGCLQFLLEVGSENIQPDNIDLLEETIEKHIKGAFYLMNRAIGYGQGDMGASAYQVTGLVTNLETGEPIYARVEITELYGPMLHPRLTDEFGRYRWILEAGTYSLVINARGYEMYNTEITPNSANVLNLDVALQPLPEYILDMNVTTPETFSGLINLEILDHYGTVFEETFSGETQFILPEGAYWLKLHSEGLFPEFLEIEIQSDTSLVLTMDITTELYLEPFDELDNWQIVAGDWAIENSTLISQNSLTYAPVPSAIQSDLTELALSTDYALLIKLRSELEWTLDSAYIAVAGVTDTALIYWTAQNWLDHEEIHYLGNLGELLSLEMGIIPDNSVEYRGFAVDELIILGRTEETRVENPPENLPDNFTLEGCFPNPFNNQTNFTFALPQEATISFTLYDLLGQQVDIIYEDRLSAGKHEILWDAGNLPSGVYFLRMRSGNFESVKKIMLLK